MEVLNKISNLKSHISNLFYCFVSISLFIGINSANAQLTFNNTQTAQQLAQMLAGPGVSVSNAVINCAPNGIGSFSGSSGINMSNGIILTSGSTSVASPNTSSSSAGTCNNTPGDNQLNSIAGATTFDACALEFDIIPLCDTLKFKYVFGSEEYPEYVNTSYNDAFAFFISGPGITGQQNIAVVPGTTSPVTINSINSGNNSQYYITNSGSTIEYDGYTTVLTAWAAVQPCQTYHLRIVIVDGGDCIYDSGIFLQAGSLQCLPVKSITGAQNGIEGCQDGIFKFCHSDSLSALTFNYTVAGTAVNGTDYNNISNSIIIPAGQSCISLPIILVSDGLAEPGETIKLIYQLGACPVMDTAFITITDSPLINAGPDTVFCSGGSATIGIPPVTGTSYSWSPAMGLSNAAVSNPSVTLTNGSPAPITSDYILTASIGGCISSDTVEVTVNSLPVVNAGPDQTICGGTAVLAGSITGGDTSAIWSGGLGVFGPNNTTLNCTYTPSTAEIASGSITLILTSNALPGACPSAADQTVILFGPQATVSAGSDQTICSGNTAVLAAAIGGSATAGIWSGGSGTYNPDNADPAAVYTPSAAEAAAGTVTLTYTANDPTGTCIPVGDQMAITIMQLPTANAGSAQYVCSGSSITLAGSIGGSASSGTWSGGSGTFSPNNMTLNAVYTPSAAEYTADSIVLTLTTNDPAGPCAFSTSIVTLHFLEGPLVDFAADTSAGCPIHCTNFTNLSLIGSGSAITSWQWDFGDGSPGSALGNPLHCFSETGFYDIKLIATANNGCTSYLTRTHLIQVYSFPNAGFSSTPNPASVLYPTITFSSQSSSDVNYWNWDFGDNTNSATGISNPTHDYPNNITDSYLVTLVVHNAEGCYDTISHEIIIEPEFSFFIPNSFSPNNDGINDYFFGSGVGIIKYDIWIFDRWGNMIFHGKELTEKWNGKAKAGADPAQTDVYVWKVQLTDIFNKIHNYIGTVTLVK